MNTIVTTKKGSGANEFGLQCNQPEKPKIELETLDVIHHVILSSRNTVTWGTI